MIKLGKLGGLFSRKQQNVTPDEKRLALYMGYAFSHGINIQHILSPGELTVPYVVHWNNETPTPVPYPAATQQEAVANAYSAREQASEGHGWSSGLEGAIDLGNGTKMDILVIEGWVPGLVSPLEMFVYCRREPFRLVHGFMWKGHEQARKDAQSFMADFKRGILMQPFGQQCLEYVENGERVQFTG